MDPPKKPISERENQSFPESFLSFENPLTPIMVENKSTATRTFFENVSTEGSNPLTPTPLKNIEIPDIMAVHNTSNNPF